MLDKHRFVEIMSNINTVNILIRQRKIRPRWEADGMPRPTWSCADCDEHYDNSWLESEDELVDVKICLILV